MICRDIKMQLIALLLLLHTIRLTQGTSCTANTSFYCLEEKPFTGLCLPEGCECVDGYVMDHFGCRVEFNTTITTTALEFLEGAQVDLTCNPYKYGTVYNELYSWSGLGMENVTGPFVTIDNISAAIYNGENFSCAVEGVDFKHPYTLYVSPGITGFRTNPRMIFEDIYAFNKAHVIFQVVDVVGYNEDDHNHIYRWYLDDFLMDFAGHFLIGIFSKDVEGLSLHVKVELTDVGIFHTNTVILPKFLASLHEVENLTVIANSGENVALPYGHVCLIQCRIVITATLWSDVKFDWYKDGIYFITHSIAEVKETGSYHCVARLKVTVSGCIDWTECDIDTECYQGTVCSGGKCCVNGTGEVEIEESIGPSDIIQVYVDPVPQATFSPHGSLLDGAMEIRCPVPVPPNFEAEFVCTWYKNSVELIDHTNPALLLNEIDADDMGNYRCTFRTCDGGSEFRAQAFSVSMPVNMDEAGPPTIGLSSQIPRDYGDPFTVTCQSPRPSPGVIFTFWIDSVQQTPSTADTVSGIATNNSVEYKCKTTFNGYTTPMFSNTLDIHDSISLVPSIDVSPPAEFENNLYTLGNQYNLTCQSNFAHVRMRYQWFDDGSQIVNEISSTLVVVADIWQQNFTCLIVVDNAVSEPSDIESILAKALAKCFRSKNQCQQKWIFIDFIFPVLELSS